MFKRRSRNNSSSVGGPNRARHRLCSSSRNRCLCINCCDVRSNGSGDASKSYDKYSEVKFVFLFGKTKQT